VFKTGLIFIHSFFSELLKNFRRRILRRSFGFCLLEVVFQKLNFLSKTQKVVCNFSDAFDIRRRVAYLSQAAMCAQSAVGSEKQMNPEAHDFLQHIRDKLDVAQVQFATKYAISYKFFFSFVCYSIFTFYSFVKFFEFFFFAF